MNLDPQSPPLAEFPARLSWTPAQETIHAEPPWLCMRLLPEFPACNPAIANTGIVWDVLELFQSARRPGSYRVLNSECGYPPNAGIEEPVFVSHPDEDAVVWEIDALGLAPVLAPDWAGRRGFVRLVFEREAYESDICAMLDAIRAAGSPELPVEELDPDVGGLALEQALALDCGKPCAPEPVLPPGTLLEFGFFGSHLFAVDGKPDQGWPTRLFARWSVYAGFRNWLEFVSRGFALSFVLGEQSAGIDLSGYATDAVKNNFFLLRESERTACDRAGEELVNLLKASFSEGGTTPGIELVYRACDCPAVLE